MRVIFFILLLIPTVLLLLLFLKLRVEFGFKEGKGRLKIGYRRLLFSIPLTKALTQTKKTADTNIEHADEEHHPGEKTTESNFKLWWQIYKAEKEELLGILYKCSHLVDIDYYSLLVSFGFSNAAATGIANGIMWTILSQLDGFISSVFTIRKHHIVSIVPCFSEKKPEIDFTIAIETRLIRFARFALHAYRMYKKIEKKYLSNGK